MFVWMIFYGIARFLVELIRADNVDHVWMGLSFHFSQYVAMVMVFVGVVGWWMLKISSKENEIKETIS